MSFIEFMLEAHSGWRYLVILATFLVVLFFVYALATRNTKERQEKIALSAWAGIVDMQLVLGLIVLVYFLGDGRHYGQLVGHYTTGFIMVFVAHIPALYKRLNGEPSAQVRRIMGVVLPIVAFLLVWIGISAINRPLFG